MYVNIGKVFLNPLMRCPLVPGESNTFNSIKGYDKNECLVHGKCQAACT